MPVTLSARAIGDALARLQEHDIDAQSALAWLGWDGEAALRVRRYDLLLYLAYQLPTKCLASLEDKQAVAGALGSLLELAGADDYAALCRSPDVERMLRLWEGEDPAAPRRLLEASGLEPPDTAELSWGPVMGLIEADARDRAVDALELALEAGDVEPSSARRRGKLVTAVLAEPAEAGSRLDAIHAERLDRWRGRRSPERSAIVGRVAPSLMAPASTEATDAVEPARWLLERGEQGIALTQTGALARGLVREAAERWPHWWSAELFDPPHRETDVAPLHRLHGLLRDMRLLRRSGRRLLATARGRALREQPDALLAACAEALLAGDSSDAAISELAAALLLIGEPADADRLAEPIHVAIASDGWHSAGEPPSRSEIAHVVGEFLLRAEPLGIVVWRERRLTAAGHGALHHGLRARALGPATTVTR